MSTLEDIIESLREPLQDSLEGLDSQIEYLKDRIKDVTFYRNHIQELLDVLTN